MVLRGWSLLRPIESMDDRNCLINHVGLGTEIWKGPGEHYSLSRCPPMLTSELRSILQWPGRSLFEVTRELLEVAGEIVWYVAGGLAQGRSGAKR